MPRKMALFNMIDSYPAVQRYQYRERWVEIEKG